MDRKGKVGGGALLPSRLSEAEATRDMVKGDTQINGAEKRTQKQTPRYAVTEL